MTLNKLAAARCAFLMTLLLSGVRIGSAEEAASATAATLAQRVYDRPDGKDVATRFTMTLTRAGAAPRQRLAYSFRADHGSGEVRTLLRFADPADIRDTGLLVHSKPSGDADQWLYLPALDQVRRIASERRGGSFVGSDICYEDLEDRRPDRDRHALLGTEVINGQNTQILQSVPVDAGKSVYSKRIAWIHEPTLLPLRVDFYQSGDQPTKRLTVHKVEQIQGYWTVTDSTMTDLATGNATRITVDKVSYDQSLPESLFTTQTLADPATDSAYRPK
jgi:hypothetical protein